MIEESHEQTKEQASGNYFQRWLDQAEYLLAPVLLIPFWLAGLVDFIGHKNDDPTILGRYDSLQLALIVAYILFFALWLVLVFYLPAVKLMKRVIAYIQKRPILFALCWVAFAPILWVILGGSILGYDIFAQFLQQFTALEIAIVLFIIVFSLMILVSNPDGDSSPKLWRRMVLVVIGLIIGAEVLLQVLTFAGLWEQPNLSGLTVPYGRLYQPEIGLQVTNRYGWNATELAESADTRRIILSGDTFVQALQVPPTEHLETHLEILMNDRDGETTDVIEQGLLGYGATQFLNPIMSPYLWEPLNPDEIVVFFHLANDYQLTFDESGQLPRVAIDENGNPIIVEEDFQIWHDLAHISIRGHDPIDPWRTIFSHSMLINWLGRDIFYEPLRLDYPSISLGIAQASNDMPFGIGTFLYETEPSEQATSAFNILAAQVREYTNYMSGQGIRVRFVTIPYFPQSYIDELTIDEWTTNWLDYDLLQPERELARIVAENDASFLGMTAYLQDSGLSLSDIEGLYLEDGAGEFSVAGHRYFAEAVFACFYDDVTADVAGCELGSDE